MNDERQNFWYADIKAVAVREVECAANVIVSGPHVHRHCYDVGILLLDDQDLFRSKDAALAHLRYVIMQQYAQALSQLMKLKDL